MLEKEYKNDTEILPTVSVIIPVFNDQNGINRCLTAISLQNYPMDIVEVIVVDNGSALPIYIDKDINLNVKLLKCEIPGSYAARNVGAKNANNQVFCFTDADCWPDINWLYCSVSTLVSFGDKYVIGGDVKIIKPEKKTPVALYQYMTGFDQENNIKIKGFSVTANLICYKKQFEEVGFFSEKLFSGGDLEWSLRASNKNLSIIFESSAVIYTEPRITLRSAIIQARRVTAGRRKLKELNINNICKVNLSKKRSALKSIAFIFSYKEFSIWDRFRIFFVASLIYLYEYIENIKLSLGAKSERR